MAPGTARTCLTSATLLGALCLQSAGDELTPASTAERLVEEILLERAAHVAEQDRYLIAAALSLAEKSHGIDSLLLLAVMEQESRYRTRARGEHGALGLLQVRPATARDLATRHAVAFRGAEDLLDPLVNVRLGAAYLAELHRAFESWDLALTAYSHGPTRARRARSESREPSSAYAARVLERYEALLARWRK